MYMREAEGKLNFRERKENGIAQPYVERHECSQMCILCECKNNI